MKNDRFLTGILVVIGLLVAASLGAFFLKQGDITYLPEDTPEGVVHNYVLALQQGDHERAYGYLAEAAFKPDRDRFRRDLLSLGNNGESLQIGEVAVSGDEATVEIIISNAGSGPFFERYSYSEMALLTRQDGAWKLMQMPYNYWGWDWYQEVN